MADYAYNKRAGFDFEILEKFEAGLSLLGTEVKSIRKGHMSLRGSFVTIHNREAFLTNATIPPWQISNAPANYDPVRSRKLLLSASELKYLIGKVTTIGLTIVPIRVYNEGSVIKVEIGLAKGKKQYDHKADLKRKDLDRRVDQELKKWG